MEVRSDHARGGGSSSGSGKASAAVGKGKNRAASPDFVGERREASGTEPGSTWTGEKKSKIETTRTSEDLGSIAQGGTDHSSGDISHGQEQIEGLDWDIDRIHAEINCCLEQLQDGPGDDCDEEGFWRMYNEEELRALNQRLALFRIRAHDEEYRELDDDTLSDLFPPSVLEENEYFKHYERQIGWYFDPCYCKFARFVDYQRLMLHNNGLFEEFEFYRDACSTLEGDLQFVQFWEELSSKTKLIELFTTDTPSNGAKIAYLLFYHALKIATGLPHVYKALIILGFGEFRARLQLEYTMYELYVAFLSEMLDLVANRKMNIKEALRHVYNKGNHPVVFTYNSGFTPNFCSIEKLVKPHLDRIVDKAQEGGVHVLIMDAARKIVRSMFSPLEGGHEHERMTYYDYVKKKLDIAREIRLIPLNTFKKDLKTQ